MAASAAGLPRRTGDRVSHRRPARSSFVPAAVFVRGAAICGRRRKLATNQYIINKPCDVITRRRRRRRPGRRTKCSVDGRRASSSGSLPLEASVPPPQWLHEGISGRRCERRLGPPSSPSFPSFRERRERGGASKRASRRSERGGRDRAGWASLTCPRRAFFRLLLAVLDPLPNPSFTLRPLSFLPPPSSPLLRRGASRRPPRPPLLLGNHRPRPTVALRSQRRRSSAYIS